MTAPLLYPYQRRYLRDGARFKAGMWSRQTGKTFTTALEAVLDVLEAEAEGRTSRWTILSVSRDRALDAMDNGVKLHLRAIGAAFTALDVPLAVDELAHVVRIGERGSYIRAIAAKPETARGMSDNLILDEFAHHQDNRAIWTALFPVISKPGLKVRVISTPNGVGDKFHEIMSAPELAGLWSRHTVTIHDAVAEGLPRDIAELKLGMNDPDAWAQEFECAFLDNAARAWLPFDLIMAAQSEAAGDAARYTGGPCFVGMDLAARGDLTVIAVLEVVGAGGAGLPAIAAPAAASTAASGASPLPQSGSELLICRELIELRGASFAEQLAELDGVMQRYRVTRVAIDQTGLGEMPVQEAQRRHGSYRIEGVIFTAARKLDMAVALKDRLETRRLLLPPGQALVDDLRSVRAELGPAGIPRLLAERQGGSHADRFWALALAVSAAAGERPVYAYESLGRQTFAPRRADFDRQEEWAGW